MTAVTGLRLACGVLCGVTGTLTVVTGLIGLPMVASASRIATEFGYYLVLPALIALLPGWRRSSLGRVGAVLNVFAIMLLVTLPIQAWEQARPLPDRFTDVLGAETRERHRYAEQPRDSAFVLSQLVRPVSTGPVRFEQRTITVADRDVTLDIYRPSYSHEPIPGVLVVHGESGSGGLSTELVSLNGYLAARDYLVVGMRDPFQAGRDLSGSRDDLLATVAYLKEQAGELGLDADRLALMGRSVAGYLPLLVAYTSADPSIQGVVAFYAPSDVARFYAETGGTALNLDEATRDGKSAAPMLDVLDAASPIRHVEPGAPPTLLIHGVRDAVVSSQHSERLAARLKKASVQHVLVRLPWANHACDQNFAGPCGQITTYAVERFLDGVMAESTKRRAAS